MNIPPGTVIEITDTVAVMNNKIAQLEKDLIESQNTISILHTSNKNLRNAFDSQQTLVARNHDAMLKYYNQVNKLKTILINEFKSKGYNHESAEEMVDSYLD